MNDEYLWNKTGTDAEIEEMENALWAFRFEPSKPPAIPAKVATLPERRSFSFFKLGFAIAFAAAVFVALVSVLWLRSPRSNPSVNGNNVAMTTKQPGEQRTTQSGAEPPIMDPPMPKPKVINLKPPSSTNATRAVKVVAKKDDKITPEEQHAYDQLMKALAITSGELKFVKDKINGRDVERTAARDRQK